MNRLEDTIIHLGGVGNHSNVKAHSEGKGNLIQSTRFSQNASISLQKRMVTLEWVQRESGLIRVLQGSLPTTMKLKICPNRRSYSPLQASDLRV